MKIVWDINKAATNIRDHGIEFSHAATVLDNPMAITNEDIRRGERWFVTVGSGNERSGVGPKQVIDFMSQCLKKKGYFLA